MIIDYYYSKEWKCWMLLLKDEQGNQVGEAENYFTKRELNKAIKEKEIANEGRKTHAADRHR